MALIKPVIEINPYVSNLTHWSNCSLSSRYLDLDTLMWSVKERISYWRSDTSGKWHLGCKGYNWTVNKYVWVPCIPLEKKVCPDSLNLLDECLPKAINVCKADSILLHATNGASIHWRRIAFWDCIIFIIRTMPYITFSASKTASSCIAESMSWAFLFCFLC